MTQRTAVTIIGLQQRGQTLSFGGAPVVIANLANHFARRGIGVEVVVFSGPNVTALPFAFDPTVRITRVHGATNIELLARLVRVLLRSRPAQLLTVGNKAAKLAAQATLIPGISPRLWVTLHHSVAAETAGWTEGRRRRRIQRWRRIASRATGIIAVSEGVKTEFGALTKIDEGKLFAIYNPIVDSTVDAKMLLPVEHHWLDDSGPPLLLGVGRLTEQKDFATLIRAFAELRKQRPCRLLILGEGEERMKLTALAKKLGVAESVQLPGFQPNPLPFMKAAKLLVMSSGWEGMPVTLVEALACGTPVVSTDCPHGPREILADGRLGELVPVGDVAALTIAIARTLDEPTDPAKLRARALDFTIEAGGDRYIELMGLG